MRGHPRGVESTDVGLERGEQVPLRAEEAEPVRVVRLTVGQDVLPRRVDDETQLAEGPRARPHHPLHRHARDRTVPWTGTVRVRTNIPHTGDTDDRPDELSA